MRNNTDIFTSRFGVLVAMAGSAVGLGNLWRFPYLVGENGGAAFIIIYLVFVFILCLPILMSEFVVGRRSQASPCKAFGILAPGSKWGIVGIFATLAAFFVISFYSVVGGWSVAYLVKAIGLQFSPAAQAGADYAAVFTSFVSSPVAPLFYDLAFLAATAVVVIAGIKNGIERFGKILMPILFVLVILLAIRSITLPGASAGLEYLFKPDFSQVNGPTFLAALGQAFFSLSIGCGTILTYGSYVKKSESIGNIGIKTAASDTLFALIAGVAIMPAVFAFGISPSEGPGLVFVTLPNIFAQMPLGGLCSILFFFTLFFAAITSSISLLEVPVAFLMEARNLKRSTSVLICFFASCLTSAVCSLSMGVLGDVKLFGMNFFNFMDFSSANIFMTGGGLLLVIFVGWALKKADLKDELTNGGQIHFPSWLFETIYFIIKFIAPVVIATVMITNWL